MKIKLPLPPNRANARWHWTTERRLKVEYYEKAGLWILPQRLEPQGWQAANISATLYVWAMSDWDNLHARLKWPLDFLVNNNFIKDDSPLVLKWVTPLEQEIDRKNQRIEFRLTELRNVKIRKPGEA
jgi:Holliday junction resolvase RusA-like endonuclease